MACTIPTDPFSCTPSDLIGGVIGGVASSAWETVCKSFADAAVTMLKGFAAAFAVFPNVDLTSDGVRSVYGMSLGIAGVVATLLLFLQIARTVITHDGNALAQGFVGVGKAALAFMLTLTVASTGLVAADALTVFIINQTFGNTEGLTTKLTTLFEFSNTNSPALVLLLAVIGILLVAVLWFELLLRNAAVAVLIASSPISAAGMASEATKGWWSMLVSATGRLIVLKPVIALVFAVGFGIVGNETKDLGAVLAGMLILLLAVLAWPAIARFFTFTAAHSGGASGLAAVLGFAAGRSADTAGGAPSGVAPDEFGQHTEARTMASYASRSASAGASASTGAGGAAAGGGAAAAGAGAAGAAAGAGIPLLVAKGLQTAQRAVNSLAGRMEQTAGHAGLPGASPWASPAGYARPIPSAGMLSTSPQAGGVSSGGGSSAAPSDPPPPAGGRSPAPVSDPVSGGPNPAPESASTGHSGPEPAGPAQPVMAEHGASAALPDPAGPSPAGQSRPVGGAPAGTPTPPPSSTAAQQPPSAPAAQQPPGASPPVMPQQRPASPVEHLRPEPSRPAQSGPVQHLRPAPSSPIEFEKGDPS